MGQAVSLPNCGLSYFLVRQADSLPNCGPSCYQVWQADSLPHESIAFRVERPPYPRCATHDMLRHCEDRKNRKSKK